MAMFNGGGLFPTEPADAPPKKTVADLERELAVAQERNKLLEEQTKLQRDSFLQLNQHSSEQARLLRDQLTQQVARQHPGVIPQAPSQPPASASWEDLVDTIAGGKTAPSAPQTGAPVDPQSIKQMVRQTLLEEANHVEAIQRQEKDQLTALANQFSVQYPDLASNKKFTSEVDRIYMGLKSNGMPLDKAWNMAIQEAAHIHKNYNQRRQPSEEKPSQQQQTVPGAAYMFPMGIGGHTPSKAGDNLSIDLRPPEERFKDASRELSEFQKEAARRNFGGLV